MQASELLFGNCLFYPMIKVPQIRFQNHSRFLVSFFPLLLALHTFGYIVQFSRCVLVETRSKLLLSQRLESILDAI
jgi:hypothetical protein